MHHSASLAKMARLRTIQQMSSAMHTRPLTGSHMLDQKAGASLDLTKTT